MADEETPTPEPTTDPNEAMAARLEALEKRANSQDATISRKDNENKDLRAKLDNRDDDTAMSQAAIAALARSTQQTGFETEEQIRANQPNLQAEFKTLRAQAKQERETDEFTNSMNDIQKRVTSLGYKEGDNEYFEVFGRAAARDIDGANQRLDQLEKAKGEVKVEAEAVHADPPDVDALVEEKARQLLEEKGQLTTDNGTAAGGSRKRFTMTEVGAMPPQKYKENFPTYGDFMEAVNRGEITEK